MVAARVIDSIDGEQLVVEVPDGETITEQCLQHL
jgi:hypothetical protein